MISLIYLFLLYSIIEEMEKLVYSEDFQKNFLDNTKDTLRSQIRSISLEGRCHSTYARCTRPWRGWTG